MLYDSCVALVKLGSLETDILTVSLLPRIVKLTSWLAVVALPPLINKAKPFAGGVGGKNVHIARPPPLPPPAEAQAEVAAEAVEADVSTLSPFLAFTVNVYGVLQVRPEEAQPAAVIQPELVELVVFSI